LEAGSSFLDAPISSVMGRSPKSITQERFAKEALALLVQLKIDQLLVVDSGGNPIGMVDIQDVAGW
jgi:CBS domain-containing protein